MKMTKKLISGLLAAVTAVSAMPALTFSTAEAAASYPVQKFQLAIYNTNRNVNSEDSSVKSEKQNGTAAEDWTLNYISAGVYEIVNSANGQILTANGNSAGLAADKDGSNQRWKIEGVEKDFDGYYLYYKVTSNADGKALTFDPDTNSFSLESYSGAGYQKYKLNLDGLEGFAANCKVDKGEKAGTIGGLLGPTVFVSTADDLEKQLNSVGAQTIVVTANIDMQKKSHTRIRDNKTLVGSFGANTIYDSQFRTNDVWGTEGDNPSDNIVFRNLDMQAKNVKDRILINIWSSRQIWIDHLNFNSTLSFDKSGNGLDEVGKFIWLNTPYESYKDAKDMWRSPDYMTISYCKFTNRYWTVAYGTQNGEITRDRTTLLYNWWNGNIRRCPQIGNGSAHVYNNYYNGQSGGNNKYTSQIIGGDNSDIVSENNRFDGITQNNAYAVGDYYRDSNSYLSTSIGGTPSKVNLTVSKKSTWYPNKTNYGYSLLDAYNTSNTDAKTFCQKYAGCFKSDSGIKYIGDKDFASWVKTKYDSPFLKDIEVSDGKPGAVLNTALTYEFKNVGSGYYLEVADSKAENGANVQQGDTGASKWTVADAGKGYYKVYSEVGDGKTFLLDLDYGKTDNGTNIGIWGDTNSDAQLFKFVDNGDGTYAIVTKATKDKSGIGIAAGSTENGANAVQWSLDGSDNQKWVLEASVNGGELIQNIRVSDVANADAWKFDSSLAKGDLVFGDREVTYATVPEALLGAETILTACDSKNTTTDLASFVAGKDMTVYIAMDNRVTEFAAWMDDYTKTDMTVSNNNDVVFDVYSREVKAGETVVLGTNNQNYKCVNYTVFAKEKAVTATTTTTTTTTTTSTTTETEPETTTITTTTTTESQPEDTTTTTISITTTTTTTETEPETTTTTTTTTDIQTETTTSTTSTTTTASTTTTTVSTEEPVLVERVGDANMDGKLSMVDLVHMNKYVAGLVSFNDNQKLNADCYKDGAVNGSDATALLRFLLQVIDTLPVIPE